MVYFKSFNKLLQNEYKKRKEKNSAYSIRSFARDLEISPSLMLYYLNDQRTPTKKTKLAIGKKLKLSADELKNYTIPAGDIEEGDELFADLYEKEDLNNDDVLAFASDYYHHVVLEAMMFNDIEYNYEWFSNKFNLSVDYIEELVNRLIRLGYLEIKADGIWEAKCPLQMTNITKNASIEVNNLLQVQVLDNAKEALKNWSYDHIDQTSIMFATNTKNLPEIKDRITKFRRELAAEFGQVEEYNTIYQFSFSAFPVNPPPT